MKVERVLPTPEAAELLELVDDIARDTLAPRAALAEREGSFPRDAFAKLGASGLLGLPYPEQYGGAAQPYEVYLQVVEELSRAWLTVGLGISVHTSGVLPARPLRNRRTTRPLVARDARRHAARRLLPLRTRFRIGRRCVAHARDAGR